MSTRNDMKQRGGHPTVGPRRVEPGKANAITSPKPLSPALKGKLDEHGGERRSRVHAVQARKT
jgi:hypothetical protein